MHQSQFPCFANATEYTKKKKKIKARTPNEVHGHILMMSSNSIVCDSIFQEECLMHFNESKVSLILPDHILEEMERRIMYTKQIAFVISVQHFNTIRLHFFFSLASVSIAIKCKLDAPRSINKK